MSSLKNIIIKIKKFKQNKTLLLKIDEIINFRFNLYHIKYCFYVLFQINPKKIVFDNFQGKGYYDNPKYLAEQFHKLRPDYEIIWLYNYFNTLKVDFPKYVKVVHFQSSKALFHLATAKYWIFNYRPFWQFPKRNKQIYIQTWHGSIGPKMIEKDAEQYLDKDYIKRAKYDSSKINICISGSKHLTNIYKNSFWYNGLILDFGSPRNDILFDSSKKNEILNKLNIKNKKICLYAPTFRNNLSFDNYDIDFNKIKTFLHTKTNKEWEVLVRFHPHIAIKSQMLNFEKVINVSNYPDAQELLLISDILITDYSSIIYDYCLLKRPGFIYASDYEEFINNERPTYFKLEDTPFSIAKNTTELIDNMNKFNYEHYKSEVESFLQQRGCFEDGHATEKTVNYILSNY